MDSQFEVLAATTREFDASVVSLDLKTRAGAPTTIEYGGISPRTSEPAAITHPRPT